MTAVAFCALSVGRVVARRLCQALHALCVSSGFVVITAHATAGSPGTLDPFWGTGSLPPLGPGKVRTVVADSADIATGMAKQSDGKIVVAGICQYAFCAVRYNADGTQDMSFGGTGRVTTAIGTGARAQAIAIQPDGKVLLAGYCINGSPWQFCAVRYLANGLLDTSFNGTGIVTTALGPSDAVANALTLQPDGKFVLAGTCGPQSHGDFCAARYLANGTLDASFGAGGKVVTQMSPYNDMATGVVVQPDGKLVLGGGCTNGSEMDFCALRLLANGTPDPGFGSSGIVITAIGGDAEFAHALALQPDGKLVLAGYCHAANANYYFFCAQRLLDSGAPDPSFGNPTTGGVIVLASFTVSQYDVAHAVAVLLDGKLLLAGVCYTQLVADFCVLRLHANGELDSSFNGTGKQVTKMIGPASVNAIALQPDGKVLLAGECYDATSSDVDFCVVRYDGGPFGYQNCKPDIDGDGRMTATIDGLINMRVMLGITGPAVISGVSFPANATRNTWPLIRDYLVSQCGMQVTP